MTCNRKELNKFSSIVVEYLQSSESPAQVAVFYCEESYDAKCILRSVLCQLIESQLAELTSDSIIVKKLNALCKGPGPTDRQLKDALVLTGNSNSCVSFIVIDALDELEDEQRTKLMETISQLVSKTLRVLITCRPGCKETNRLATVINVASHENDVRLFLEQRVEDTLNRREILARQINAEKRARIVDHIARQTGKL
jgi:hypothetical protein